jgi:hypothetical protein
MVGRQVEPRLLRQAKKVSWNKRLAAPSAFLSLRPSEIRWSACPGLPLKLGYLIGWVMGLACACDKTADTLDVKGFRRI